MSGPPTVAKGRQGNDRTRNRTPTRLGAEWANHVFDSLDVAPIAERASRLSTQLDHS